jgi:predicted ribosomally synthesized peptide with nif11-like leader
MSQDSATAFLDKLDRDPELRDKLFARGRADADRVALTASALIELGHEQGFVFSADELRKAYAARGKISGELGEEELDAVAGGKANFTDFVFTHKVDKASPILY